MINLDFTFIKCTPFDYLVGNTTYLSQPAFAAVYFFEGGCGIIDGIATPNPVAKPLFFTSSIANMASAGCLVGAFCTAAVCPPVAFASGLMACSLRRVGKYMQNSAVAASGPVPTFSGITSLTTFL